MVGEGQEGFNREVKGAKSHGGCTCLCVHEGEGRWCTLAQTEPPGLGFAIMVANTGRHRPGCP